MSHVRVVGKCRIYAFFLIMNIPARTLSEVSANPSSGPSFTVHRYENPIHPSEDQPGLLTQGYRVISAAICGDLNWTSPNTVPSISRKRHGVLCSCSPCARPHHIIHTSERFHLGPMSARGRICPRRPEGDQGMGCSSHRRRDLQSG